MGVCNETHTEKLSSEKPIWHSLTFHHIGLIISATFGLIAVLISILLILRHASHFLRPWEQTHIIRILFMIPIYATVSFLSYVYYQHAIYFEVLRDCYEAFAIASFFTLMCHYIAPTLHDQKEYFRNIEVKNWMWPLNWMQRCTPGGKDKGVLRRPRSGLTWFNIVYVSIFQYCFIRVFFTFVSLLSQTQNRYCESSLHPQFAHIWVLVFEGTSVTIAMYCLIQFYFQLKPDLARHSPFLKILCIKLVIFFCFWQALVISVLTSEDGGRLKPSAEIAYPDLKIGIPSMLICVEMSIFALLHVWAFSWKEYDLKRYQAGFDNDPNIPTGYACGPGKALLQAFNPWDTVKAIGRGFRWLFVGVRHRTKDVSYQQKNKFGGKVDMGYISGPTFAGNGEAATEMRVEGGGGKKKEGFEGEDDDTVGLLGRAQSNPFVAEPYVSPYAERNPDSLPAAPTPGQEFGVERMRGGDGRPSTEWDMFGGARR